MFFLETSARHDKLVEHFASVEAMGKGCAALPQRVHAPPIVICAASPFDLGQDAQHMGVAYARRFVLDGHINLVLAVLLLLLCCF